MARVRDAEAYHLARLAQEAAYEAERLCDGFQRAVSRSADSDNGRAADVLAHPDTKREVHRMPGQPGHHW